MERAQRELVCVLLDHVRSLGLITNSTYLRAMDLTYSATNFPEFFQYPVRLAKEVS